MPEPWLRERALPCDPAIAAVLFALEQAEEDLGHFDPPRSAYFHLRHIAGSLDRLTSYLEDKPLDREQIAALEAEEIDRGESREDLLAQCHNAIARTRAVLLNFPPDQFASPRYVGRNRIRTTAIGLMIHIAEHTQRHVGEIIAYTRASCRIG